MFNFFERFRCNLCIILVVPALLASIDQAECQGTAFNYSGILNYDGRMASGSYDFKFSLSTSSNQNMQVGMAITNSAVAVTNGLFAVMLDFGPGLFTGNPLWMAIGVRTNGDTNFTALSPLQPVSPTPYAIMADNASNLVGTLPASQLIGTVSAAQTFVGSLSGDVTGTQSATVVSSVTSAALPAAQITGIVTTNHLPSGLAPLAAANGANLTNIQEVSGITIPMGAWFTNNVADGLNLTAATPLSITNAGDAFAFTHGATNVINCRFALPWDWDAGTVQFGLRGLCTGSNAASATNIVWGVRAAAIGDGDPVNNLAWGPLVTVTNHVHSSSFISREAITGPITIGNSPSANKSILWQVQRIGGDAGDTMTNINASLTEVRIYYRKLTVINFPVTSP